MALPFLESMVPAQTPLARTAATPTQRFGFVYVPHGSIMKDWTPTKEGVGFEFSPILKPLEPFRDQVNVITGLFILIEDTISVGDVVQVDQRTGSVESISLTKNNQAAVKVSVQEPYAPLHEGTQAVVRLTSLSGIANRYVGLTPGPSTAAKIETRSPRLAGACNAKMVLRISRIVTSRSSTTSLIRLETLER